MRALWTESLWDLLYTTRYMYSVQCSQSTYSRTRVQYKRVASVHTTAGVASMCARIQAWEPTARCSLLPTFWRGPRPIISLNSANLVQSSVNLTPKWFLLSFLHILFKIYPVCCIYGKSFKTSHLSMNRTVREQF